MEAVTDPVGVHHARAPAPPRHRRDRRHGARAFVRRAAGDSHRHPDSGERVQRIERGCVGGTVPPSHEATTGCAPRVQEVAAHAALIPDRERGDQPRLRRLRQRLAALVTRSLRVRPQPPGAERLRIVGAVAVHAVHVRFHSVRAVLDLVALRVGSRGRVDVAAGAPLGVGLLSVREPWFSPRQRRGL